MSEPVDPSLPEVSEALAANGENEGIVEPEGDQGEESDEYEVDDEERQIVGDEDDEEEEEEENERQKNGLTAMLLKNPDIAEEEEEEEEGDDDDDDEYVEEVSEEAPITSGKKRSIDHLAEDADQEANEEGSEAKKVKA